MQLELGNRRARDDGLRESSPCDRLPAREGHAQRGRRRKRPLRRPACKQESGSHPPTIGVRHTRKTFGVAELAARPSRLATPFGICSWWKTSHRSRSTASELASSTPTSMPNSSITNLARLRPRESSQDRRRRADQQVGRSERFRRPRTSRHVTSRAASSSHSLSRVARSPSANDNVGTLRKIASRS